MRRIEYKKIDDKHWVYFYGTRAQATGPGETEEIALSQLQAFVRMVMSYPHSISCEEIIEDYRWFLRQR